MRAHWVLFIGRWARRVTFIMMIGTVFACGNAASEDEPGGGGMQNGADGSSSAAGTASGDSLGSGCPGAQSDDIWLDKRLGCLNVGQEVSTSVGTAPGDRADRAFEVRQQT